ncbi:MAG: Gfo/Idh/MocA family oxidoreductase [Chitinophagaceae bacterium]|nr:Gfo/Idh/MocA family oxidoreductase [Chitinophagaceae bacterium]
MNRKIRMGMIGGGRGAFIGAIHRYAIRLDNQIDICAGAFHLDPEISMLSGQDLFIERDRIYPNYYEFFEKESKMPVDKKIDFVTIVTPNHVHFEPSKLALEHGFHVVCEKPLSFSVSEAIELEKLVQKTDLLFAVTHTYTGYPMVKQAKEMIASNIFGNIRKIVVEYPQGWLSTAIETTGNQQASWRTDPKKSGKAGSIGDIGTHAANLAEYITGLQITELCADITTFVSGRLLDDDGNILIRFNNGAKGVLHCSQISAGEENALNIRVYGEKGGIQWAQMEPNTLIVKWLDKPTEIYRTGMGYLGSSAKMNTRTPAGHPEGYLEAFGNIYKNVATALSYRLENKQIPNQYLDFPNIHDGVRGMKFIDAVIQSSQSQQKWIQY